MIPWRISEAVASINRGLLDNVTPSLRFVAFRMSDRLISLRFVFEFPPSDLERELVELTVTSVYADLDLESNAESQVETLGRDARPKTGPDEHRVYSRYEAEWN